MVQITSPAFKQNAARALADAGLQKALGKAKGAFLQRRAEAVAGCRNSSNCATSGATSRTTPWPISISTSRPMPPMSSAPAARCIGARPPMRRAPRCWRSAARPGAKTVTKGKSMISEEISINDHLEAHGITPVETDLGEYIIQLRHEHPSPHHRARLPPEPGGLGGGFPPHAHRPRPEPRVQRAARHPGRGAHEAALALPRRRCRHHRGELPDRRDRQSASSSPTRAMAT